MKINEIYSNKENIINENYVDFQDIVTTAKSFIKQLQNPNISFNNIKQRVLRDRAVDMSARSLIEWWKKTRYNIISSYGESNTTDSYLRSTLEKKIRKRLGSYIYGYDEDTLEGLVGDLLINRDKTSTVLKGGDTK